LPGIIPIFIFQKEMRIQKRSDAHLMNTGCAFDENKPASFFTHHFFVQETKYILLISFAL